MSTLSTMSVMYGPPVVEPTQSRSLIEIIFSLITSPVLIIISFIVGIILFLKTKKKIFVIIPTIMGFFYLIIRIYLLTNVSTF